MTGWTSDYRTVLGSSAMATGVLLVITEKALAHEGHPHRGEAESASPLSDEKSRPDSETAVHEPPASVHIETGDMPTSDMPMEANETPIEGKTETQSPPTAVSQASVTEGFSIGLGESIFGLIIAGPFLLLSLKRQLQSR